MFDSFWINKIADPQQRIIMVIGAPDLGKTTVVWSIGKLLRDRYETAIVDLDMGQSHIGPPTTIAWAKLEKHDEEWSDMELRDLYFTGTVTPFGSLLPAITGAKLIAETALGSAEKVVIDTTGLISDPVGRILKLYKIDIITPDIVLAIESSDEISHIIDPLRFNQRPEIIRIPAPSETRIKTQIRRAGYRFERMMKYLEEANIITLQEDKVGIRFLRNPLRYKDEFINRIVSLRDRYNKDKAIGVVMGITKGKVKILTPLVDPSSICSIVIGKAIFDMKERILEDH